MKEKSSINFLPCLLKVSSVLQMKTTVYVTLNFQLLLKIILKQSICSWTNNMLKKLTSKLEQEYVSGLKCINTVDASKQIVSAKQEISHVICNYSTSASCVCFSTFLPCLLSLSWKLRVCMVRTSHWENLCLPCFPVKQQLLEWSEPLWPVLPCWPNREVGTRGAFVLKSISWYCGSVRAGRAGGAAEWAEGRIVWILYGTHPASCSHLHFQLPPTSFHPHQRLSSPPLWNPPLQRGTPQNPSPSFHLPRSRTQTPKPLPPAHSFSLTPRLQLPHVRPQLLVGPPQDPHTRIFHLSWMLETKVNDRRCHLTLHLYLISNNLVFILVNTSEELKGSQHRSSSPLDPLLAALLSVFIISTAVVFIVLFFKMRQRTSHPEFHRLQDLPMVRNKPENTSGLAERVKG